MKRLAFVSLLGALHFAGSAFSQEPAKAAIEVRLVDDAGAPIDDAQITARPGLIMRWTAPRDAPYRFEAVQIGEGRFVLESLPPGAGWRVYAYGGAFRPSASDVLELRAGTRTPIVLQARRGSAIRGRIADVHGNPVEGALVRASSSPVWYFSYERLDPLSKELCVPRREVRSNANGRYEISGLEPGRWLVDVRHALRCRQARFFELDREAAESAADFALSRGARWGGVVCDGAGNPIAGATVAWDADSIREPMRSAVRDVSARTDGAGRFEFACLESRFLTEKATGWLEITAPGFAPGEVRIELAHGVPCEIFLEPEERAAEDTTPEGDVGADATRSEETAPALPLAGGSLRGRLTTLRGEPAWNHFVAVYSVGREGFHSTKSDEQGRYAFELIPPGTYVVTVAPPHAPDLEVAEDVCERAWDVAVAEGETTILDLALEDLALVTLRARLRYPDGTPPKQGFVYALRREPFGNFAIGAEGRTASIARDGRIEIGELFAGPHYLCIFDTAREPPVSFAQELELTAGDVTERELVLPATRIAGRVVDQANRPLAGVSVTLRSIPYRVRPTLNCIWTLSQRRLDWDTQVFTDEQGCFLFEGWNPGGYSLHLGGIASNTGLEYDGADLQLVDLLYATSHVERELRASPVVRQLLEIVDGQSGERLTAGQCIAVRRPGTRWREHFHLYDENETDLWSFAAGEIDLLVAHRDYAAELHRIRLTTDDAPPIRIPLRRGAEVRLRAQDGTGRSMAQCRLHLEVPGPIDEELIWIERNNYDDEGLPWPVLTDGAGILIRRDLPFGRCRVRLTRGSQRSPWTEIEVPRNGSLEVPFTLR